MSMWSFLSHATNPENPMPRLRGRDHDNIVAEPHYSREDMMLLPGMAMANPCHTDSHVGQTQSAVPWCCLWSSLHVAMLPSFIHPGTFLRPFAGAQGRIPYSLSPVQGHIASRSTSQVACVFIPPKEAEPQQGRSLGPQVTYGRCSNSQEPDLEYY